MNVWLRFVRIMLEDPPQLKQKFQKPILTKFTRTLIPPPKKKERQANDCHNHFERHHFEATIGWSMVDERNSRLDLSSSKTGIWEKQSHKTNEFVPEKGIKTFQQENTSEPTIDFQGAVVSFQGSFPWLETKYSSNRAGSMVVESVKHDLPQIQEKGASVSPFLVIFFPKETMCRRNQ